MPKLTLAPARTPPLRRRRHPARQDGRLGVQGIHLRDAVPEALLRRVRGAPRARSSREQPGERAQPGRGREARGTPHRVSAARHVLRAADAPAGRTSATSCHRRRRRRAEQGPRRAGGREPRAWRACSQHIDFNRKVGKTQHPRQEAARAHPPLQQVPPAQRGLRVPRPARRRLRVPDRRVRRLGRARRAASSTPRAPWCA